MSVEAHKETLDFQTEVRQLLNLMIHSLYSNREIFLRELISNAADAIDKLRFEALTDDALYEGETDFRIRVGFDKEARTITVSDNGIGMSRVEVIENLGTIAKSGTRQFLESLSGDQAKDARLIGQFGVGFYSSFIVADKVTVLTRRAGLGPEHGVHWESTGEGAYTVETIDRPARGTEVTLHLRADQDEFLDSFRLRTIIHKYSDHIPFPILMPPISTSDEGDKQGELETVNQASALWARPKTELRSEDYEQLYKHVAHDFEAPLAWVHSRMEGRHEYTLLLYLPAHAPFDLWERNPRHGVKLYVRRVFIMEDNEHLLPRYLRFVRGVIDSDDLPLNISREILQHSKDVDTLRAGATRKVLEMLEDVAANDKYGRFWNEFGSVLKEGVIEDHGNRERVAKLLRFSSTHTDSPIQEVSLEDYIARMKEGQETIYYVVADSFIAAKNSPHLEVLRDKGVEVLLLHERVDEWLVAHLTEFQGKRLQSVAKGTLDLGKLEEKQQQEGPKEAEGEIKDLVARVKQSLGERVKDVRVSRRLTSSPACLVTDEHDLGIHLERLLKAAGQDVPRSKPILEVNPAHPLIQRLKDETAGQRFDDWASLLFDQALLSEGGQLEDPASFVHRLNDLLLVLSRS
jgi:molecular chaperone HtpG